MILQGFPDLGWLKEQISQRFQQRRAFNNLPLETVGFPSVIINTSVKESYRPDIVGPISLFLNRQGSSRCTADGRTVTVEEGYFFISNRFQPYTLEIESSRPVETFNIHFGEFFSEGVLGAMLTSADKILNDGRQQAVHTVAFYNRLYRRDNHFNELVTALHACGQQTVFDKLLFEEQMTMLLNYLLLQHRHILQQVHKMPALKLSTRTELYRRLSYVTDYIHSSGRLAIDLDELAAIASLSKYHFLRLFKQSFGLSPHQYIQQVRIDRAKQLLKQSNMEVQDIADELGFENSQSFSRLFHQRTGIYPLAFRA
jgi:AraC family transcriptional regulator